MDTPDPPSTRLTTIRTNAQAVRATMHLAQALTDSGERIDLHGLDDQVGRLCAAILDLPPEEGRALRDDLIALDHATESLRSSLRAQAPPAA